MQSCSTCPARKRGDEVRDFFGKDFGPDVDACSVHGHVLGRPGLDASSVSKVHIAFGTACQTYGASPPASKPDYPEARVTAPSPEVFGDLNADGIFTPRPAPTEAEQGAIESCRGCQWFVPDTVVRDELGWYLPLCAATGRLLMPARLRTEPRRCGQARPGENRTTTEGNALRPEYDDAFQFGVTSANPIEAFIARGGMDFIEPTMYPTDRPVTADETSSGIRAWRRVFNNDASGRYVDLPIFDIAHFDEHEASKIPRSGDDEHPEWYVDHAGLVYTLATEMMELDETPLLIGPAGTGKTELARHFAWLCCLPFDRVSITRSTEIDDIAGKWLFTDNETRWGDGRVTDRWGKIGVLLVDEPNTGPDEVWQFFRPMTDNSKQLVLDQGRGEKRERNAYCFFLMAINPSWDVKYVGANEISEADGNRLAAVAMGLPPEDTERMIIMQRCIADGYEIASDVLDKVMAISADIREMTDPIEGTLMVSWGLRPQIAVARKTRWYDLTTAYKRAIVDRLDPQAAETILRIVDGYVE